MLADTNKGDSGAASVLSEALNMAASDAVQEQLSPFDNIALDADIKVCLLCSSLHRQHCSRLVGTRNLKLNFAALQRAVFRDQMKAEKDRRKTVKLSMQLEPGRQPPTAQEVEKYQAVQAQHAENMRDREAAAAAERRVTKMRASGACSFVSVQTDVPAPSGDGTAPRTDASKRSEGSNVPSAAALQGPSEAVLQLLRCKNASNDLAKRACSLKRFVTAAGIIIIRCWIQNQNAY